jgi:PAS domain S-box-containing protein
LVRRVTYKKITPSSHYPDRFAEAAMENERELLIAVLALQTELIDAAQFAEVCRAWKEQRDVAPADWLLQRGWLDADDRAALEHLAARRLTTEKSKPHATAVALTTSGQPVATKIEETEGCPVQPVPARGHSGAESRLAPDEPPPPVERYTREQVHAVGGMGRVWRARDRQFDREVALKELRPDLVQQERTRNRFLREAQITGQLEHPGIVPVYEMARAPDGSQPYYAMRFVRGRTLVEASRTFHAHRQEGHADSLELVSLLTAFVAVCNAIAYAHSQGVIHRDLKGENVLLGEFGEVVVLDWGLAKVLRDEAHPGEPDSGLAGLDSVVEPWRTVQGAIFGTPAYMAPEQASGQLDHIDQRTDIYGLGAVLYEILTGRPPFTGLLTTEVLQKVLREEPTPPRHYWPEVPAALEKVCLRALAKEPAERPASAAELGQAIQHWQEVQRRQAEDALRRQTKLLQSILDSMTELVMVCDAEGRLTLLNAAAERIPGPRAIGMKQDEALQRHWVFLPDQVTPYPPEQSPLARAIRGEAVTDVESFIRPPHVPDGLWISTNARPLLDEMGKIIGGVAVHRDITERKRVEEELRRSRERFELAVRGSQDGLWDWDLETNQVYYSPRWKSILGHEDHEIAHTLEEWARRLHPDERERVLAANHAHINGTTPHYEYEYRLRHKDGSYCWILARGTALRRPDGKAYRMAGSHVDVTARKQAEAEWKTREERYQAILEALAVGVLEVDAAGTIRTCTSTAAGLLGRAAEQTRGHAIQEICEEVLQADGSVEAVPPLVTWRTGLPCSPAVVKVRKGGGEVRRILLGARPLSEIGPDGGFAVVAYLQPLSERP